MKSPKFTIIIPVYNCEQYVGRCLDSVLRQDYGNYEIICIDDCSTDSSLSILKEYGRKDKRITVIESEVNAGALGARRKGVLEAKGEYIIFIDSDDYVANNLLSFAEKTTNELGKDIIQYSGAPVTDIIDENYRQVKRRKE